MSYHSEIMNICSDVERMNPEPRILYKNGHRDARHAAAEIALKADAEIEEMRKDLEYHYKLMDILQDLPIDIDEMMED